MFVKKSLAVLLAIIMALVILPMDVFEVNANALTANDNEGYDFSDLAPDDTLGYDLEINYNDFITDWSDDLDNNFTFEPGFDFSELGITPAVVQDSRDYENRVDITLSTTINGADFKEIFTKQDLCIINDPSDVFFAMQGSCFDGEMVYFAFTANRWVSSTVEQLDLRIVSVPINESGNLSLENKSISVFDKNILYHANDITYNSITNQVVVAACVQGDHDALYTINAEDLQHQGVSDDVVAQKHNISCPVTSIDFSEKESCYFVGITGELHLFAKLDYDFNYIGLLGDVAIDESLNYADNWYRQAICVDNNYIYSQLHRYIPGAGYTGYLTENMIEIYDLKGNYKKTIYFTVENGTDKRYEIENINIINGKLLIGFNCAQSLSSRWFCYYDFTENCFSVKYCPDDNIVQHSTDSSLPSSPVLYNFGTRLFSNSFSKNGYRFIGWHACRDIDGVKSWFYENKNSGDTKWIKVNDSIDPGYTKYEYSDKETVAKTGPAGSNVYMCAQWKADDSFIVKFSANGGTGTMGPQTIKHGNSISLISNTFTKQNRTFQGWNAYWVEKNQWLYQKNSTGELAWYVEGAQPAGYKKYTYSNCEKVSKTVHKGNTVIMYALWDEFYIYYHSNGKSLGTNKLLKRTTGRYAQGCSNQISAFSSANFTGYHLYRREIGKWYYENKSTNESGWYKKGSQPTGYTLHLKTFSNSVAYLGATAPSGEHLVLYAQWN